MESEKTLKDPELFPVIYIDHGLLGRILTEYGHLIGHIPMSETITIKEVAYDEHEKILTAFINLEQEMIH